MPQRSKVILLPSSRWWNAGYRGKIFEPGGNDGNPTATAVVARQLRGPWPDELGHASASGSQNGVRYAFFPDKQRLLIEENGELRTYDSGDHRISGVSQQQSHGHSLAFTSQSGVIDLDELRQV